MITVRGVATTDTWSLSMMVVCVRGQQEYGVQKVSHWDGIVIWELRQPTPTFGTCLLDVG